MFDLLGGLVAAYVVYALFEGSVLAKRGPWGERIERAVEPHRYWVVITIYAGLAVALVTVF
jgi:hypothetical protein